MDAAGNLLDGHMTKWNETTGYDPDVKLETQMQVEGPAGTVTLPTGGLWYKALVQ